MCRLCGQQSGISINIFDESENHVRKINAVLPIMVRWSCSFSRSDSLSLSLSVPPLPLSSTVSVLPSVCVSPFYSLLSEGTRFRSRVYGSRPREGTTALKRTLAFPHGFIVKRELRYY